MSWLTGWFYRKSVTLSRATGAVSNYQMKLLLGESSGATGEDVDAGGLCLSSFDDIRFTTSDGTTLLDYWIESISGTTPNQLATIWIEFDSIDTGATTFYMYYGNAGASAVSSGPDTFALFDHFDGGSLDLAIWTLGDGSVTQATSIARLVYVGAGDYSQIYSDVTYGANYRVRTLAKYGSNSAFTNFGFLSAANYGTIFQTHYPTSTVLSALNRNPFPTETASNLGDVAENAFHVFEIIRNSTINALFSIDDILKATNTTNVPSTSVPVWFEGTGQDVYIDWVFVSSYLDTEPAWGVWGDVVSGINSFLSIPVSFSGTLQRTIEVGADLSVPVLLSATVTTSNINATLSIPITFSATLEVPIIHATLPIPITMSGTMIAPEVLTGTLSIPISLSGTMSEIDYALNAGLTIPISIGGTIEVNPMYDLVLVKNIPSLQITAEAYDSTIGVFVKSLPSLGITASGYASVIANALMNLPRLGITATGSSVTIGNLTRTLPRLELSGIGIIGSIGTLSVTLPSLRITATSYGSVIGTASITLPSLILSSSMVPLEYLTMVMNLKNQALTEFTNYEFNSMCHYKGLNLGATKTGIHLLDTGDTDNDTAIDWNFRTGLLDLHMKTKKKLRQAWLSCKINGDLTVTIVEASGDEYEYDAESYETTEDGVRVKFGRGLKQRYLAIDVKNDEQATIVLDSIRLNLDKYGGRR